MYNCRYCDRTFTSAGVRDRHEESCPERRKDEMNSKLGAIGGF